MYNDTIIVEASSMISIKNKKVSFLVSFVAITVGALLAACALENFLLPNTVLDGGVNGI